MKKRVLHFVRKSSQLKASFIYNQINNHIDFEPFIVYRKNLNKENKGGFADFDYRKYPILDLSENETIAEEIRFKTDKKLSSRQIILILDFIRRNNIKICHFHYGTDCGVFYPILKMLKIPTVVSFYGYDCYSFPKSYFGFGQFYLKKRVFKHINNIIAMTPEMKKDLISAGCPKEKIIIHYHGIPSHLSSINRVYKQKRNLNLLMLSYFDPVKGHIFVFNALKQLLNEGISNFDLTIVGRGHYEQTLKSYIKDSRMEGNVHFANSVKYLSSQYFEKFTNADIFLHPSVKTKQDKEGIPGSIVEAMFAGLPIISTYHGGIPYIIENERNGLLVKEWDTLGLEKAIKSLLSDNNKREALGQNGRSYATDLLDINLRERELENIYTSIIN